MKLTQKKERLIFAAAAAAFVILLVVLVILLSFGRGESPAEATPTPSPSPTAGTELTIGGQSVKPDADTFYLNNHALTAEEIGQIQALSGLRTLSLTNCSLSEVSFLRSLPELTTLYLSGNSVSDLSSLSSLSKLRTLYLDKNPVTDLTALNSLSSLGTLSLKGVSAPSYAIDDLREQLPNCHIFDDSAVDTARPISLGGLSFTAEDTLLDLSSRGITDITKLSYCQALVELSLAGNPLESIATLTELPVLQRLNLSSTGLDDNDLRILSGMRKLTWLNITGNPDLGAEALEDMKAALSGCQVIHDEVFYKVTLGGITLTSDATAISLPALGITSLKGLNKFTRLESVDLSSNALTDLTPLSNSSHLRVLNLENNRIVSLQGLYGLSELETLDLSENQITDLSALGGCTALKRADLSNNNLNYISHLALCTRLEWLDLRGNPQVSWDMIAYLRNYLPLCEILTDAVEPTPEATPEPTPVPTPVQSVEIPLV